MATKLGHGKLSPPDLPKDQLTLHQANLRARKLDAALRAEKRDAAHMAKSAIDAAFGGKSALRRAQKPLRAPVGSNGNQAD